MRWRSESVLVVSLVSAFAPPAALFAQTVPVPTECACLLSPDKPHGPGHPDPGTPGVPGTPGDPGNPGGPGDPVTPDSLGSSGSKRAWVYLGAAGVALLAGLPLGGAGVQGLPFAQAGAPAAPAGGQLAESTPTTGASTDVPIMSRGDVAPSTPVMGSGASASTTPIPPGAHDEGTPMPLAMLGLVPPKTATHLPLLGALGVLLVGAGGLLARRASRERRRRRRFVAI